MPRSGYRQRSVTDVKALYKAFASKQSRHARVQQVRHNRMNREAAEVAEVALPFGDEEMDYDL